MTSYNEFEAKPKKTPRAGKLGPNWEGLFRVKTNSKNKLIPKTSLENKAYKL